MFRSNAYPKLPFSFFGAFVTGFIALVFTGIVCTFAYVAYTAYTADRSDGKLTILGQDVRLGINGWTATQCINGYMFVMSQDGRSTQMIDEFGKALKCPVPNAK